MRGETSAGPQGERFAKTGFGRGVAQTEGSIKDFPVHNYGQNPTMTQPVSDVATPARESPFASHSDYTWDAEREKVKDIGKQLSKTVGTLHSL